MTKPSERKRLEDSMACEFAAAAEAVDQAVARREKRGVVEFPLLATLSGAEEENVLPAELGEKIETEWNRKEKERAAEEEERRLLKEREQEEKKKEKEKTAEEKNWKRRKEELTDEEESAALNRFLEGDGETFVLEFPEENRPSKEPVLQSKEPVLQSKFERNTVENEQLDGFLQSKIERNTFNFERIEPEKETGSEDKDTGVQLHLDEIRLRSALSALKAKGYTRCQIAVASEFYRHGERFRKLEYMVSIENFCEEIGVSRTSCWSAVRKLQGSDLFKMLMPVPRIGTMVHLDGSFFLEQDRRKRRSSVYDSIKNDYKTTFFSCLIRLLVSKEDLTPRCEASLKRFAESLRKNAPSSGDKAISYAGKLLHAICSMLLRGNVERPAAYLTAVTQKEGEKLIERLSGLDLETSEKLVGLLEKAFKEDPDDLSGDEWSVLFGEKTDRRTGVRRFTDLVAAVLTATTSAPATRKKCSADGNRPRVITRRAELDATCSLPAKPEGVITRRAELDAT